MKCRLILKMLVYVTVCTLCVRACVCDMCVGEVVCRSYGRYWVNCPWLCCFIFQFTCRLIHLIVGGHDWQSSALYSLHQLFTYLANGRRWQRYKQCKRNISLWQHVRFKCIRICMYVWLASFVWKKLYPTGIAIFSQKKQCIISLLKFLYRRWINCFIWCYHEQNN